VNKTILTQDYLSTIITYSPDSGVITRNGKEAGYASSHGYRQIEIKGKAYMAHHVAWVMSHGVWPKAQLDHINHNRTDNRIDNLREVNNQGNRLNLSKRKDNSSGHTGLYKTKSGKYIVRLCIRKKIHNLGTHSDITKALSIRDSAYKALGFHVNHGK